MTNIGSLMAKSSKNAMRPAPMKPSISPSTMSRMPGSSGITFLRAKARSTSARYWPWDGGSFETSVCTGRKPFSV